MEIVYHEQCVSVLDVGEVATGVDTTRELDTNLEHCYGCNSASCILQEVEAQFDE